MDTLSGLLQGVVKKGTGTKAAIDGYVVAGKTGTAQKIDGSGHYSAVDYVASFVGFVPASHPALVVLVSLDSPRGLHEGGQVAAPVFARVAEQALRARAVPPDDPTRVLEVHAVAPGITEAAYHPAPRVIPPPAAEGDARVMPELKGASARDAAIAVGRRGLVVELRGTGHVVAQDPPPGTEIEPGMACVLTLSRDDGPGGTP